MKLKIAIFLLICVAHSCDYPVRDVEFTMSRTAYTGNDFRLDGYYSIYESKYNNYSTFIFFRNGVLLSFLELNKYDIIYNNFERMGRVRNSRDSWCIYNVKNDTISIQAKRLIGDFSQQYTLFDLRLKIINDTTLMYVNDNSSVLLFNKFSPKPDSTNIFIK